MPISSWQAISDITAEIVRINPKSVLDLGVGFGLYGAICRNYLDAMHGRCSSDKWEAEIIGYEGHSAYQNAAWYLYDKVHTADFSQFSQFGDSFDLVLMIDSLEHLAPSEWKHFLDMLVYNNRNVIVSVPNGVMEQGAAHGNELERHRTTFYGPEFDCYNHTLIHCSLCRVVSIRGKLA